MVGAGEAGGSPLRLCRERTSEMTMPERPQDAQREVLTDLEVRKVWANEHHRGVERSLGSALDHAIQSGEHLIAAKEQVSRGEWIAWVEKHFEGSLETAQVYMRLARNQENLNTYRDTNLSISEARRILSPPKEEEPGKEDEVPKLRSVVVDGEPRIKLPDGRVLPAKEAFKESERKRKEEVDRQREILKEELEKAEKRLKEAKNKPPEVVSVELPDGTELSPNEAARYLRQMDRRLESLQGKLDNSAAQYAEYLASLHQKYGVSEAPDIAEIPGEMWREAIQRASTKRTREAKQLLMNLTDLRHPMNEYSPEEAARVVLELRDPERVLEGLTQCLEWLDGTVRELKNLTTKGQLRALKS
jgi:hypothetical protein